MSRKVFLVLLVCTLMVIGMFSGCGSAPSATQTTTAAQAQQTTQAATTAAPQVVSIVMERPLFGDAPDPTNAPNVRLREAFKKATGIDVQIVGDLNPDDASTKPNLMIASGEKLDIFQVNHGSSGWPKYKQDDTIIPLNDLLDKYGQDLKQYVDPNSWKELTDSDGKIWALPDESNPVTTGLLVRKDWLTKDGLSEPVTVADFENVFKTFKDKNNDQGWLPGWSELVEGTFSGSFMQTGSADFVDTDGKLKPWYCNPQAEAFLAKMAEWYKKGYIHKEASSITEQQLNDTFFGGKSGMLTAWVNGNLQMYNDQLKANVPDGVLEVIAPPKGDYGPMVKAGLPVSSDVLIAKSSTNPEAAMKFLDYSMATDEGYLLAKYGQEGVDYNWVDKSKNLLQATDGKMGVDRIGYPIFCSTRLNYFTDKYSNSQLNSDVIALMADKTKYPSSLAVDAFVNYDVNSMKSKDNLNSLYTFINENKWKVIMGQEPASSWGDIIKKWLDLGGQQMIDDYTAQYNAAQK